MVFTPDQLVWEIVRRNNCFQKKRNGKTKRSGTITFSVEKGNLKSLNLLKYSGLANTKTVDVIATPEHQAQLITKSASKCHQQPNKAMATTSIKKHFRQSVNAIKKNVVSNHYRPDLKRAALGKYTKVYNANRRAKGIKKTIPAKKGRQNYKLQSQEQKE
jgi:large subunit ribosomal protein L28e